MRRQDKVSDDNAGFDKSVFDFYFSGKPDHFGNCVKSVLKVIGLTG